MTINNLKETKLCFEFPAVFLRLEEEFYREWEDDQRHNVRHTFLTTYSMRAIKTDVKPDTNQPFLSIVYIRIRRQIKFSSFFM